MLNIYSVSLQVAADAAVIADRIFPCDADLARQLRRAATSVPLNIAEGGYSQGRLRAARYHSALGSARETLACVEVAQAMRYLGEVESAVTARMNQVIGTLVRVRKLV